MENNSARKLLQELERKERYPKKIENKIKLFIHKYSKSAGTYSLEVSPKEAFIEIFDGEVEYLNNKKLFFDQNGDFVITNFIEFVAAQNLNFKDILLIKEYSYHRTVNTTDNPFTNTELATGYVDSNYIAGVANCTNTNTIFCYEEVIEYLDSMEDNMIVDLMLYENLTNKKIQDYIRNRFKNILESYSEEDANSFLMRYSLPSFEDQSLFRAKYSDYKNICILFEAKGFDVSGQYDLRENQALELMNNDSYDIFLYEHLSYLKKYQVVVGHMQAMVITVPNCEKVLRLIQKLEVHEDNNQGHPNANAKYLRQMLIMKVVQDFANQEAAIFDIEGTIKYILEDRYLEVDYLKKFEEYIRGMSFDYYERLIPLLLKEKDEERYYNYLSYFQQMNLNGSIYGRAEFLSFSMVNSDDHIKKLSLMYSDKFFQNDYKILVDLAKAEFGYELKEHQLIADISLEPELILSKKEEVKKLEKTNILEKFLRTKLSSDKMITFYTDILDRKLEE